MQQFHKSENLRKYLSTVRASGKLIGFVPTMGALHEGHLTLIEQAKAECDLVICSIFVNPLQFNRQEDLDSYPNRNEEDQKLLIKVECDILFKPTVEEIYADEERLNLDLGSLNEFMEAEYRPGHFQGMVEVIHRFFKIIEPDYSYFGIKDYQQLAIVKFLTKKVGHRTKVIGCETYRAASGLAMSSRNYNLIEELKPEAPKVYQSLNYIKTHYGDRSLEEVIGSAKEILGPHFKLEYLIVADEETLSPVKNWDESKKLRAFIAAYLGEVRLIDNLAIN